MKKLLAMALALAMSFTLVSCGSTGSGSTGSGQQGDSTADSTVDNVEGAETTWKPSSTISWIIPYGAGGQSDLCVRILAEKMGAIMEATIVPENKDGGGGKIAADYVVRQKADGLTITMGNLAMNGIQLATDSTLEYDNDDFTFICMYLQQVPIIAVRADAPYNTVEELVEAAKAAPGAISYCTSGAGTSLHFVGELLQQAAGITLSHIPYGSGSEMAAALLGGHVNMGIFMPADAKALLESGDFKALAVTSTDRTEDFPDVPSLAECGYESACMASWHGIVGPAGISDEAVQTMAAACEAALKDPAVVELFESMNVTPYYMSPEELKDYVYEMAPALMDVAVSANLRD